MKHCQFGRLIPGQSYIHMLAPEPSAKPVPTLSALNDACRAVSLFARYCLWSFSRISSRAIKPDRVVENLVFSKLTEGSVAQASIWPVIASALALAGAVPVVAQNDKAADQRRDRPTFTAKGLPPGIQIDPFTGIISGVVDRAAIVDGKMAYDIEISVHDINGGFGRSIINLVLPNQLPVAGEDLAIVKSGVPSVISVLDNDIDADGDQLALLWAGSSQSNTVAVEGRTVIFTAVGRARNEDIVTYAVSDGHGGKATGRLRVIIAK